MGQALKKLHRQLTASEFLASERTSETKHEFHDGQILDMAGSSARHVVITGNFFGLLWVALRGKPCQPYNSDLRIAAQAGRRYVYPDITVICGPIEYDSTDRAMDTGTNPRLVIEVMSPSTERHDRGVKFTAYQQAASFREYVLVAQDAPMVETFYRQDDGVWAFNHANGLDAFVRLKSIDVQLPLAEIYANVRFDDTTQVT